MNHSNHNKFYKYRPIVLSHQPERVCAVPLPWRFWWKLAFTNVKVPFPRHFAITTKGDQRLCMCGRAELCLGGG